MTSNRPEGRPQMCGGLYYDDPEAAIDWLVRVFGFELRVLVRDPEGGIAYNELAYGEAVLSANKAGSFGDSRSPRALGGANTQSLYLYVDDIDAHHARAAAGGATIVSELETKHYGDRGYSALDLEGHVWSFGQRVDDAAWDAAINEAPAAAPA